METDSNTPQEGVGKLDSRLHSTAAPSRARAHAHAHEVIARRRTAFLGHLSVELQKQIELEHEITLQVATMMAAGVAKREIISALQIADVIYEMCAYRLRSLARGMVDA